MVSEIESPEQLKARMEMELRQVGVEKIEEVDGVVFFHFTGPIFQYDGGRHITIEESSSMEASLDITGHRIKYYLGKIPLFRSIEAGDRFFRLSGIRENGIDRDVADSADEEFPTVDMTISLKHASEFGIRYGTDVKPGKSPLSHSRMILVYDITKVQKAGREGAPHKHRFLTNPKEALLGVLLLYGEADKENGLVEIK